MIRRQSWDKPLFFITLALLIAGIFIFASGTIGLVGDATLSPLSIFFRQIFLGLGVGSVLFIGGLFIPFRFLGKAAPLLFALALLLLLLIFIPGIGMTAGGATRWVTLGPITLQPAEPFKLAFIIYLAAWLTSHKKDVASFQYGLLPFLIISAAVSALFIFQPDIGTLFVILLVGGLLFFIGGGKIKHMALAGAIAIAAFILLIAVEPYRIERIRVFLHPQADIEGSGYQIHQALIAIGSGGITGKGFGQSIQKFHYLPEPVGDAIFAVVGEEFGFIGGSVLILLFLAFLWRSILLLIHVPNPFARLLGAGIVILILSQSFINIAALIGIIPMTGIPLVFISQGGSSLAITLAGIGILLNISRYSTSRYMA